MKFYIFFNIIIFISNNEYKISFNIYIWNIYIFDENKKILEIFRKSHNIVILFHTPKLIIRTRVDHVTLILY